MVLTYYITTYLLRNNKWFTISGKIVCNRKKNGIADIILHARTSATTNSVEKSYI